jgi:hypothetical protein
MAENLPFAPLVELDSALGSNNRAFQFCEIRVLISANLNMRAF